MVGQPLAEARTAAPVLPPWLLRLLRRMAHRLARWLAAWLGAADTSAVSVLALRELALTLRSRAWHRFLGGWVTFCAAVVSVPLLYRLNMGNWTHPTDLQWYQGCGYLLQIGAGLFMAEWSIGRIRRDLYTDRLDELILTRCSPADIAMGQGVSGSLAALWMCSVALPAAVLLAAMCGRELDTALRLVASLFPAAALGVWFGIGWGMAFTLRRSSAWLPLTKWWFLGPFLPIFIGWSILGALPVFWALLSFLPGGTDLLAGVFRAVRWLLEQVVRNFNPLLLVPAAGGIGDSLWLTDWLTLLAILIFMARKSMEAIEVALNTLPERGVVRGSGEFWIHHDGHYFLQYRDAPRPQARYYDGGNPIAAFDVALGHRVYLHPFLWCLAIMVYLFMVGWSLLIPPLGKWTAVAAVLTPALGAVVLMSAGVAISFGWERDQHRWPSLAVLPIENVRIVMGKIKGVLRPTLWLVLSAALTALLLGWRGALHWEVALWLGLHVIFFPVALACVSAALALTTPTVGEAIYRWVVLGALPALASLLPAPVGGPGGFALPFIPPLLMLWLAGSGPTSELVGGAWVAFGLELFGITSSLGLMAIFLRRWTVGEKD